MKHRRMYYRVFIDERDYFIQKNKVVHRNDIEESKFFSKNKWFRTLKKATSFFKRVHDSISIKMECHDMNNGRVKVWIK